MKQILTIMLAALMGSICLAQRNGQGQFLIEGNVQGIADDTMMYLQLVGEDGAPTVSIDSVRIKDGRFSFKGKHDATPVWALVKGGTHFVAVADFYLSEGVIRIEGDYSQFNVKARGTKVNDEYAYYNEVLLKPFDELYTLRMKMGDTTDESGKATLNAEILAIQQKALEDGLSFIRQHPSSPIALRVIRLHCSTCSSTQLLSMLEALDPSFAQHPKVIGWRKYAEQLHQTETGSKAYDFSLPDNKGTMYALSQDKGKYVLLDFWASWCGPCRASFPLIASLEEKHKSWLNVVGISLDDNEPAWRKALEQENASWRMVLDVKGEIASQYAVQAIPCLILIDPEGKIHGRYTKDTLPDVLDKIASHELR